MSPIPNFERSILITIILSIISFIHMFYCYESNLFNKSLQRYGFMSFSYRYDIYNNNNNYFINFNDYIWFNDNIKCTSCSSSCTINKVVVHQ